MPEAVRHVWRRRAGGNGSVHGEVRLFAGNVVGHRGRMHGVVRRDPAGHWPAYSAGCRRDYDRIDLRLPGDHSAGLDRVERTSGPLARYRARLPRPRWRPVLDRPHDWSRVLNLLFTSFAVLSPPAEPRPRILNCAAPATSGRCAHAVRPSNG